MKTLLKKLFVIPFLQNQGYSFFVLVNSVLHSDWLCKGVIYGSPPSEKQEEGKRKDAHVFLCGDRTLPEEML